MSIGGLTRAAPRPPLGWSAWVLVAVPTAAAAAGAAVALGPLALTIPVGIVGAWFLAREPLALLAVYLAVGIFKGTPLLQALPFDATLALGALLAAVCFQRLITGRALTIPAGFSVPVLLLGVLMTLSLVWTPAEVIGYGTEKVLKFWTFTLLAGLAPFFLIADRQTLLAFLRWTAIVAVVGAAVTLYFGTSVPAEDLADANQGRLEFAGNKNTIFNSRLLCSGALVLLFAPALRLGGNMRYALAGLGAGLALIALAIGSRGPILSLVLALAVTLIALLLRNPRQFVPLIVVAAAVVAVLPFVSLPETSKARLTGVAANPLQTLQGDGRSQLYAQAEQLTRDHPLKGIGTGGFFLYSAVLAREEERYPHNVFLEASSELGIPAAMVLAIAVLALIAGIYLRAWSTAEESDRMLIYVVAALFLFNLFAVQMSGDFNDNRTFWTMFGLSWLVVRHGIAQDKATST